MHLPEGAVVSSGLSGLGGDLGVGVDVVEREVPPHVPDIAVAGQQVPDDGLGLAAVGAFEVAVLDDGDQCPRGAADPVDSRVDRCAEIGDDLGGAEQGADLQPGREQGGGAEHQPGDYGRGDYGGQDARLASCSWVPLNARVAIRMDTAKPIPAIVPTPVTAAHPTGGRSRPRLSRVSIQDAPAMPSGLPATYPIRIPSVMGEV